MKYFWAFLIIILITAGFIFFTNKSRNDRLEKISNQNTEISGRGKSYMKITSPVFGNNKNIPSKYSCDGKNINPPLQFVDVPSSAKSLVLIVDDPDAPNGTFDHWVVFNIDPKTTEIKENSTPDNGVVGSSSIGNSKWVSPCPPSGTHRYFFKLYALDAILDISQNSNKEAVLDAMKEHVIAQSELIGLYSRRK